MRWLEFPHPEIEVRGLPWFEETSPNLLRFPPRLQNLLPPAVYRGGFETAGVRLRLVTDSTCFAVQARYRKPIYTNNLTQFNRRGQALYVDGKLWSVQVPEEGLELVELTFFKAAPRKRRELCLYLPLYGGVEILSLGIDEDARLEAASPFALVEPVLFYGTSITQGGCASRPGLSYEAMACRQLNLDYVNFGFSGRGKCELELAQIISTVEACCYVLDVGANNPPEEFAQVFGPFLKELTGARPQTPTVVMLPTFYNHEFWSEEVRKANLKRREVIRKAALESKGKVEILEQTECTGPSFADCTIDGAHPNELGFLKIAQNLVPVLKRVLGL